MAEPKILILDKVENLYEDKGNVPNPVIGRLVSDSAGNQLKVKVGRGGHLKNKWAELDNGIGKAFRFTMGEFKGYPFVEDFEEVKNVFEIEAAEKVRDSGAEMKPRSYSLAYSKDLAVASKIKVSEILTYADLFNDWLITGTKVEKPHEEEPEPEAVGIEQPQISSENGRKELLSRVANKMGWKTTTPVPSWIVNKCRISLERIDAEPQKVWDEIKELQGW